MDASGLLEDGAGILHLAPTWVPRPFASPGRRLRLHPDDYTALGADRGSITERWLASTVQADNGPATPVGEGISQVVRADGGRLPFDDVVAELGADLVGDRIWAAHHGWPMFAKFFDNGVALPFHVHPDDARATLVGKRGKPEAYYFPAEMNPYPGGQLIAMLGLAPETTRDKVFQALSEPSGPGRSRLVDLSVPYRMHLGTGWDIPVGVLHAPGNLCTYEPQGASDAMSIWDPWAGELAVPGDLRWRDIPAARVGDVEALLELLDWEANVDADFGAARMMWPLLDRRWTEDGVDAVQHWISYRADAFSAAELRVAPNTSVVVADAAAYGCIAIRGHGTIGSHPLESPTMIRYGDVTNDEYFVSERTARAGVTVVNRSRVEPLVVLKHFGPAHPARPLA